MAATIDQEFIEFIVKSLVANPDQVKIERTIDERGVLLELHVSPDDLGRVIGRNGSTAKSIRILLRALGVKNDARYNLKIVDTGPPRERRERRDEPAAAPIEENSADTSAAADSPPADSDQPVAVADEDTSQPADEPTEETTEVAEETKEPEDELAKHREDLKDLTDLDI